MAMETLFVVFAFDLIQRYFIVSNVYESMNSFIENTQTSKIKSANIHFLKNAKDEDDLNGMLQTAAYVLGVSMEIKKEVNTLKERIIHLFCFVNQNS